MHHDDLLEFPVGKSEEMPVEYEGGVDSGEEGGLTGGALRDPLQPQRSVEGPDPPISVIPRGATTVRPSTLGTFLQGDSLSDGAWKWVTENCEKRPTVWYCPTGFSQVSPAERGVRKTDPSLFNE